MAKIPIPPDGYCYHNVALGVPPTEFRTALKAWTDLVGKGIYAHHEAGGLAFHAAENFWMCSEQYGYKPFLNEGLIKALSMSLSPTVIYTDPNQAKDDWTVRDIANGVWDSKIRQFAQETIAFGYPLMIRFGGEMNICQGDASWVGAFSFGKNPADFIAAWRRLVDVFREEGADNAVFQFGPNCMDIGPHHWAEYYPGDDYVDWVGFSIYQYEPEMDPDKYMAIYDDYANRKPIIIPEWAVNWASNPATDEQRARWLRDFFAAVEARPKIKAISYHNFPEYRFDPYSLPLTTAAYRNGIANPRYISEVPPTPTPPRLPTWVIPVALLGAFLLYLATKKK